jgi:hypothetical protein
MAIDKVTTAAIADDLISGKTALGAEPADTDEFLVSDAGTLKRVDYSYIKGGGITMADQWRLTADTSITTSDQTISSNLERVDSTGFNYIGSGMSQSSGIFTFPSTGIYYVRFQGLFNNNGSDTNYAYLYLEVTTNNSSYANISYAAAGNEPNGQGTNPGDYFVDVTDTSNVKVRFRTVASGGDYRVMGNTGYNRTSFTFIRLGDT